VSGLRCNAVSTNPFPGGTRVRLTRGAYFTYSREFFEGQEGEVVGLRNCPPDKVLVRFDHDFSLAQIDIEALEPIKPRSRFDVIEDM
jgi:hypothetical protein